MMCEEEDILCFIDNAPAYLQLCKGKDFPRSSISEQGGSIIEGRRYLTPPSDALFTNALNNVYI